MKYSELIKFEPINQIIKFSRTDDDDYRKELVKTFVFSKAYRENLIPIICKNLDYSRTIEQKGLQIVGNYGTGKSHLMSLVSLIAEDESFLELLNDEAPIKELESIAGKFKVLRFELGSTLSLWEVITYKMEEWMKQNGVSFDFSDHKQKSFAENIQLMMAAYEEVHPNHGFLVVIDEMLAYLKSRSTADKLNEDLMVLQALGQSSDNTKFKIMFGVQEMIYHSPEFQFASQMLQKVGDRYSDLTITKEDVSFIVKKRLLKKDEHQKTKIRKHLQDFVHLFSDMHGRTEEYVELYPVHPSYFENFQKIRKGKSQREVLKTLTNHFGKMINEEVPEDNPGLITYDDYWEDIEASQDLKSDRDIQKVDEVVSTIKDKIDTHFTGARESKKEVALKICQATAIKLLQDDIDKKNGTTVDRLIDDICYTSKLADDRELLKDIIDTAAQGIITATSGQYFEKNTDNDEYFIRIEGGINFDQKIKDYAANMGEPQKDEYFFAFLQEVLPLTHDTHVTGFKIWAHNIEWKSHKTFRDGYIFFGNPDQRSTTQPVQHFYMYFLPIFNGQDIKIKNDEDEIYFLMKNLSEDFREKVSLYGAARALEGTADSSQKRIYKQKITGHFKNALELFNNEYIQKTVVSYKGERSNLNGFHIPPAGSSKEQVFSEVASQVFEDWFTEENPNYPEFDSLLEPITKDNFIRRVKQALIKVADPNQSNRDGEAVLRGLDLYTPNGLDYRDSMYAKSILRMLEDKGDGKVLNRNEILECKHQPSNLWISKDFKIEAELEFLVLAALAALGEIEINIGSGLTINSTNLDELKSLSPDEYFSFTHIKPPKGLNMASVKAVFKGLGLPDLANQLHDENTFYKMREAADEISKQAVKLKAGIADGIHCRSVEILSKEEAREKAQKLDKLSSFCDTLRNYTTEAKLKNFRYSKDDVEDILSNRSLIDELQQQVDLANEFEQIISYLSQCKQYLPEGELKQDIQDAINRLAEELSSGDKKRINQYKNELEKLRERYADYYMEQYARHTISQSDDTKKHLLLQSEGKKICDILKDADFLSTNVYLEWLNNIRKLRPAQDDIVNREAVLTTPYLDDFNPLDFKGVETHTIRELKVDLEDILEEWTESLRESLDDPAVKGNMDALGDETADVLHQFKEGDLSLTSKNALQIRNALSDLHEGLDKIELTTDSLKSTFKKPLTPDEAEKAFKEYIAQITHGKERDKVRIILK